MKPTVRSAQDIFSLAGWLFADMLLALTLVFLVVAPPWQRPNPPPPPPVVCGIAQSAQQVFVTMSDPQGLIAGDSQGVSSFEHALGAKLGPANGRIAGLVEVFGGGSVNYGVTLSQAAINAMKTMSNYVFTAKTAYFRKLWNGQLDSSTVEVDVFYLILATSCKS